MKYIPIFCVLALSACGVNSIPEKSDIKDSLNSQFGDCKYVKISDVNKLNGRDLGGGNYAVQQEFELELLPLPGYANEVDKVAAAKPLYDQLVSDYRQQISQLSQEIYRTKEEARREEDAKYSEFLSATAHYTPAERDTLFEQYQASRRPNWKEAERAVAAYKQEEAKVMDEFKVKFSALGYTLSPEGQPLPGPYLREKELRQQMIAEFDGTCNHIAVPGKAMLFKVVSLDPPRQLIALSKGVKGKVTETVTYTKTEKGWIRQ